MGENSSVAGVSMQGVQAGRDIYTQVLVYYSEKEQKEVQISVNTHHLPEPSTALIGRKTELAQLTESFSNSNKRLAIIVAAGGIGKSALTDEWLQQIAMHNYYGKTRVFGWSFYSQGSHNTFTNSQPFFSAVLPFLGINEIPKDEIEKARLLARECQKQPCLLIFDGLEPLQYAENLQTMNGELQDTALKEFLACFRRMAGNSFILLSSRQPLVELKKWQSENYLSMDLQTLPHEDGEKLLKSLGVIGNKKERLAISKDLNGHALSLVLMGHLLSEYHQGDPRYVKELPPLTSAHGDSDAEKDSRHALRVLDYYDGLQDAASRCFLQLLGLFDRPMNADEKRELLAKADHVALLRALTDAEWKKLEQRLENNGLLLGKKGNFGRLEWDTHPIIRTFFSEKFKNGYPERFKQAHLILFDYYQKLPEKEFPDTLEEMQPLYQAVAHGCLAGEHQQAFSKIYCNRINRNQERGYSFHNLGDYSQNITALAMFFTLNWKQFAQINLSYEEKSLLSKTTAHCLMTQQRLSEALLLTKNFLNSANKTKDKADASRMLVNLNLLLGFLNEAKFNAKQAVIYAAPKTQEFVLNQCRLATTLHRKGDIKNAELHFKKADELEKKENKRLLFYSQSGLDYCSLLLDKAKNKTDLDVIISRGKQSCNKDKYPNSPVNQAFGDISFARTYSALNETPIAEEYFQKAMEQLQTSKRTEFIPPFCFSRADFYLTQNKFDSAQADLNSAQEIIERCDMKLYAVDYLLIHGRYCIAIKDFDTALNHYEEAKQLIDETGYHLRDSELDLLAAKLCQNNIVIETDKNADFYLQKAKNRIEEIGQWGLMRVIERDFPES